MARLLAFWLAYLVPAIVISPLYVLIASGLDGLTIAQVLALWGHIGLASLVLLSLVGLASAAALRSSGVSSVVFLCQLSEVIFAFANSGVVIVISLLQLLFDNHLVKQLAYFW